MRFLESLRKANLTSLTMMGEPVELNDTVITAAVDDLSTTSFARAGGITLEADSAIFVSEEEFVLAGGRKGSIIKFSNGKTSRVNKISDFQGVLYLQLGPFKP